VKDELREVLLHSAENTSGRNPIAITREREREGDLGLHVGRGEFGGGPVTRRRSRVLNGCKNASRKIFSFKAGAESQERLFNRQTLYDA